VQQQEQFDARRPVAARGVAGFGPASNGTPGGPPPVSLAIVGDRHLDHDKVSPAPTLLLPVQHWSTPGILGVSVTDSTRKAKSPALADLASGVVGLAEVLA
jgi:hypothetical protein